MVKVQVLIADDHPIVRSGIRTELSRHQDFEIVGEAVTGDKVLEWASKAKIDVVILDINMPGLKTLEVIKRLRKSYPATKILVVTAYTDKGTVTGILNAGAEGFITKDEDPYVIPDAIRSILQGKNWLGPVASTLVVKRLKEPRTNQGNSLLTDREITVLGLIANGLTTKEIANQIGMAERTVEFHITNIYEKLGVSSRASAVNWAKDKGLI
jgi:NarL family two-component system response regulator YdfI